MPITDLASYLPTLDEFVAHWSAVNLVLRARGEPEAILWHAFTLKELVRTRRELASLMRAREEAAASLAGLRQELVLLQENLRLRLQEFRDVLIRELPSSPYAAWWQSVPLDAGELSWVGALDDAL